MAPRYTFGPFTLDVGNAELRRGGEIVKVAPQPFTALHLLVSRAGTLITRDEFRAAIWGDDSFVDFNAGLNFCMAQLRAALDDRAASSTFIVTVPRRGYKFVAPVQASGLAECEPDADAAPADPLPPSSPAAHRWAHPASAGVALVAVAVLALVPWRSSPPSSFSARPDARHRLAAAEKFERGALALADAGPPELPVRIKFLQDAIAADPGYAEAYAALAEAKLIAGEYRVEPPAVAYAAAKASAAHALALNSDLAGAHASFGAATMYFDWDWQAAGDHLARAVALDDSSFRAHRFYSRYLSAVGQHDKALFHAERAVFLAPASASARTDLGRAAFFAGRWEEAIASCDEAVRLLPAFVPAHRCSAEAAAEAGALGLASRYNAQGIRTAGDAVRAAAVVADGPAFWPRRAARLEAAVAANSCDPPSFGLAVAQAHLGQYDAALQMLERAASKRTDAILFAAVHPAFRPLRTNRRFESLIARIGLRRR